MKTTGRQNLQARVAPGDCISVSIMNCESESVAYLQKKVDQVGILFQLRADDAEKLDLFIFRRCGKHLATQSN